MRKPHLRPKWPISISMLVAAMFVLVVASGAQAATFNVCPGGCAATRRSRGRSLPPRPGDTITVGAGPYAENLAITKAISLVGPNARRRSKHGCPQWRGSDRRRRDHVTIKPEAAGITINGFTVSAADAGEAIYNVGGDAADVSGLTISYDIVGSGQRAVTVESDGNNISIAHNRLQGYAHDIVCGDGTCGQPDDRQQRPGRSDHPGLQRPDGPGSNRPDQRVRVARTTPCRHDQCRFTNVEQRDGQRQHVRRYRFERPGSC